jgi:hypothetical protein
MPRLFRFSYATYIENPSAFKSGVCEFSREERNIALFTNPFLLPEGKTYDMDCKIQTEIMELNSIPNLIYFVHY